ncbi:primosomal protein N' [Kutzneria sp. CA-103260]|uniref:primosomal protein N' n=1 Tax=Kutzneria sp. CA-103260 TaxID=2802641 RepID=UPI001BAB1622|nr:primosomal protein N' [Kutzneria sp. CA-103260]QUQ66766.1 primosomal protein N'/primosome assembly protein PriA [Kutzneria sp. CA-103260]
MATSGNVRRGERQPAATAAVARVSVDVPLPYHLDFPFDYRIPAECDADARPGVRVRVRFRGKLTDGFLLERVEHTEVADKIKYIERVVSPEVVLTPEIHGLARAVADRYVGSLANVLRLAVPPRHARAEARAADEPTAAPERPSADSWQRYTRGPAYLDALAGGRSANAVWQALPGEDWPARLAEVAATVASAGKGVVIVVPDYRDVNRVFAACQRLMDGVVALSADLGPGERYKRWLSVLRGTVRVVVGTKAAAFAPVADPGLFVVWDDGDSGHAEQLAPYPHVRDVLVQRAHMAGASLLVAAFARTAEAQLLVDTGWAPEIVAAREQLRAAAPRVTAIGETDAQLARDEAARTARLPAIAFEAAREALKAGRPVLVQVPRRGYVPALACANCRVRAQCRKCAGPLSLPGGSDNGTPRPAECRWCGAVEVMFRCTACGSRRLRAVVVGSKRTAEELGRAFPGFVVRTSGAGEVLAEVPDAPALVVATPGAEPHAVGGYGAALLLDGWAILGRADLRATEEALRLWMTAAGMVVPGAAGGRVIVTAESSLPTVQALVRWDPVWHASLELSGRTELGFPPAVRMATIDGVPDAVNAVLDDLKLPATGEILGPVPLGEDKERALVRTTRAEGRALAEAIANAVRVRTARKDPDQVRVRMDPLELL